MKDKNLYDYKENGFSTGDPSTVKHLSERINRQLYETESFLASRLDAAHTKTVEKLNVEEVILDMVTH